MEELNMWKRTVFSASCAALLVITAVGYAQESATLTLRSGEKVNGQLIDLGGVGYTIAVNGSNRQIPQNDVAVIDFTGGTMTDADWAKFTGTSQIVLRNGQTIDGQLYDIGGTSPLRLSIKTASGDREIGSNEVARIVIARPQNAVATTGASPAIEATSAVPGAITVQANQPWTSTGLTVRKGQNIRFTSTGTIQLSDDTNDIAGPDGAKSGRMAANAPLRQVPAGELLGKVGVNGQPFPIGSSGTITMPANGILYLGVNDDGFGDNRGNFQVLINR
jgi:hypothetical protein